MGLSVPKLKVPKVRLKIPKGGRRIPQGRSELIKLLRNALKVPKDGLRVPKDPSPHRRAELGGEVTGPKGASKVPRDGVNIPKVAGMFTRWGLRCSLSPKVARRSPESSRLG